MEYQLEIPSILLFPDDNEAKAEYILHKYMRLITRIRNTLFSTDNKKLEKRMDKLYDRCINAAKNMILSTGVKCEYFMDTEYRYHNKLFKKDWDKYLRILDAMGFIQEEYDGEEDVGMIGYHYWLFEDPIVDIPVPLSVIDKYYKKYKNHPDFVLE